MCTVQCTMWWLDGASSIRLHESQPLALETNTQGLVFSTHLLLLILKPADNDDHHIHAENNGVRDSGCRSLWISPKPRFSKPNILPAAVNTEV